MKYLIGEQTRLLAIAHEEFLASCIAKKGSIPVNSFSRYNYPLIKHPINDEWALKIEDTTYLPIVFIDRLINEETMKNNDWFEGVLDGISPRS